MYNLNMFSVIKLLFIFAFFVFICELSGLSLLSKFNIKLNIVAIPIGMVLFSSIYELLILPIQYFNLDSLFLKIILVLVFFIMICIGSRSLKDIRAKLSKRDLLLLFIFFIIVVFKMLDLDIYKINQETGDNLFYIPIVNGVSLDGIKVNSFGSMLGILEHNNGVHAFYGQLHFLAALSNLLNIDSLITINFFQTWYVVIFHITNIFNIYYICKHYKLIKNINLIIVILYISSYFLPAVSRCEVLCVEITAMTFITVPLVCYIKDNNKNWLFVFCLYTVQAISFRSSYIFVIAFFLLPYYLFLLINDRFEVKENVMVVMPVLFFLIVFLSYDRNIYMLLIGLILLVLLYIIVPFVVKLVGERKTKILYVLILATLLIFFIYKSILLGNIPSTWDGIAVYDQVNSFYFDFSSMQSKIDSISNISYLFLGVVIIVLDVIFRKKPSYIEIHIICYFFLCLNNFVAPYLSSFLPEVYGRLLWSWINPLYYLITIDRFIDYFGNGTAKRVLRYTLVIVFLINQIIFYSRQYYDYCNNTLSHFVKQRDSISFYYKVGKDSYEIGRAITDYAVSNNKKYVLVDLPLIVENSVFVSNRMHLSKNMGTYGSINRFISKDYFTQQWNEDKYDYPMYFYLFEPERFFGDWMFENARDKVPDLNNLFINSNVDVFVVKKPLDDEETFYHFEKYLESFSDSIYQNDIYAVYALK